MSVPLTTAQEQRLAHLAARTNSTPEQLVHQAVNRLLEERETLAEAVEVGRQAARRGDLLDHADAIAILDDALAQG